MNKKEYEKNLLERLYRFGYRYIARDKDSCLYSYCRKPKKMDIYWTAGEKSTWLYLFDDLFDYLTFEDKEPFDITKELDSTDWSTIPKDTKVLVSDGGKDWSNRYFKEYQENSSYPFIVYINGATSWSATTDGFVIGYKYCKIAEEE
ncbi:hypothetical protein [Veillonella montpellierensis]|uniref:hypothetical protein n=1 Tax=Veillonella montpellierensis TaxID=187328 RepID=UPI0023F7E4FD|nr:hypothetical protein [Veillonella montpellierensis]